jgi:hypothetical protein
MPNESTPTTALSDSPEMKSFWCGGPTAPGPRTLFLLLTLGVGLLAVFAGRLGMLLGRG